MYSCRYMCTTLIRVSLVQASYGYFLLFLIVFEGQYVFKNPQKVNAPNHEQTGLCDDDVHELTQLYPMSFIKHNFKQNTHLFSILNIEMHNIILKCPTNY